MVWALQDEFEDDKDKIIITTGTKPKMGQIYAKSREPFEVFVDGSLVHSRMHGDGFVDSMPKFNKIVREVEERLEGSGLFHFQPNFDDQLGHFFSQER